MKSFPFHGSREPSTALFDLDGTLVDSAGDITCAVNHVLAQLGAREKSIREIEPLIGFPAERLFQDLGPRDDLTQLVSNFRRELARTSGESTKVFPGVVELLESLKRSGWLLGVATNKPIVLAELVLEKCSLHSYFNVIVGSDWLPPKPDPAILQECILRLEVGSEGVMVGDTVLDVQAGVAANLGTIGIATNKGAQERLFSVGADFVVTSMQELWSLRSNSFDH